MVSDQIEYEIFISYSRKDNRPLPESNSVGWVSALRDQILADHRRFSTEPLRTFFDSDEIRDMDDWQNRIRGALRSSQILLVCLSPNYFVSDVCKWEWEEYLRRQTHHQMGADSVATVYFVEIPDNDTEDGRNTERLKELLRGNFTDIRPWFPLGPTALKEGKVKRRLDSLGISLWERIERARRAQKAPGNVRRINPFFVGRNRELRQLHEQLATGSIGLVSAVHGLGGMGKTELAYHYANAWADWYPLGVWSLSAEGHSQLLPLLATLSDVPQFQYGSEEPVTSTNQLGQSVLFELSQRAEELRKMEPDHPANALIILDNVSDSRLLSAEELAKLSSLANCIRIVATTRLDPKGFAMSDRQLSSVSIEALDESDALTLLRDHQPRQQFSSVKEETAAREIVRELGGYTLAVEQVAVHLGLYAEFESPTEYLNKLRKNGLPSSDDLIDDSDVAAQILHREKQLGPILTATVERLASESPAIESILQYASFMPPDQVPWDLLRELAEREHEDMSDNISWGRVRRRLQGTRLITQTDSEHDGRIHRVVAAHILAGLAASRRSRVATLVLPSFAFSLYGPELEGHWDRSDPKSVRMWSAMETQIAALLDSFPIDHESKLVAWMSNDLGTFLNMTNRYEQARVVLRRSLRWAEIAGMGDSALASRYSNLATAEDKCGNQEAHLTCIQSAVDLDRKSGDISAVAKSLTGLVEYYRGVPNLGAAWSTAMEARDAFRRSSLSKSWEPGLLESTIAELELHRRQIDNAWETACGAIQFFENGEHKVDEYSRSLRIATRIGLLIGKISQAAGFCAKALSNDLPRIVVLGESWSRSCLLLAQIAERMGIAKNHIARMVDSMRLVIPHLGKPLDISDTNSHALSCIATSADSLTVILATMCSEFAEDLELEDLETLARLAVEVDREFAGTGSKKYASDLCNLAGVLLQKGSVKEAKAIALEAIETDDLFANDEEYSPERGKTHSLMAGIYFALNENNAGKRHYFLASQLYPEQYSTPPCDGEYTVVDQAGDDVDLAMQSEQGRIGRNAQCPCGSGKKFKQCCLRRRH